MSNSVATQNVFLYCGSIAALASFWLVVLGLQNGSLLQLGGAAIAVATAVFCFRGYAAALRSERQQDQQDR